jgi:hypothetical protein
MREAVERNETTTTKRNAALCVSSTFTHLLLFCLFSLPLLRIKDTTTEKHAVLPDIK